MNSVKEILLQPVRSQSDLGSKSINGDPAANGKGSDNKAGDFEPEHDPTSATNGEAGNYTDLDENTELVKNGISLNAKYTSGDGGGESGTGGVETTSSPEPAQQQNRDILAYIVVVFAALFIVVCVGTAQSLDTSVPYAELHAIRCALALFVGSPLLIKGKCQICVERSAIKWLVAVCLVVYGAVMTLNISVNYVPLGNAICVYLAAELVSLVVYSVIRRNWTVPSLIASAISMVSVVLVVQPGFGPDIPHPLNATVHRNCFAVCDTRDDTNDFNATSKLLDLINNQLIKSEHSKLVMGYVLAGVSGVLYAVMDVMFNRPITGMSNVALGFWVAAVNVALALIQMGVTETPSLPHCWFCLLMVLFHGLAVGLSSILWFLSMQLCSMPLLAVIVWASVTIPVDFAVQYTLLSGIHPGHRNWMEHLGAVLCFVSLITGPGYQVWLDRKEKALKAKQNK